METHINLRSLKWDKNKRVLSYASERFKRDFPKDVIITSHHTGRQIKFVQDDDLAERNEFWDGEAMGYISQGLDEEITLMLYPDGW